MKKFTCYECSEGACFLESNFSHVAENLNNCGHETPIWEEEKPKPDENLISFFEATQKMEPGDRFKFGGEVLTMVEHDQMHVFKSDLHDDFVFAEPDLLVKEGVILKHEPVVLSAEDMFYKMRDKGEGVIEYGEAMHQNGRLERDLEYKGFRQAFEEWNSREIDDADLCRYFKKIKPLIDK